MFFFSNHISLWKHKNRKILKIRTTLMYIMFTCINERERIIYYFKKCSFWIPNCLLARARCCCCCCCCCCCGGCCFSRYSARRLRNEFVLSWVQQPHWLVAFCFFHKPPLFFFFFFFFFFGLDFRNFHFSRERIAHPLTPFFLTTLYPPPSPYHQQA